MKMEQKHYSLRITMVAETQWPKTYKLNLMKVERERERKKAYI